MKRATADVIHVVLKTGVGVSSAAAVLLSRPHHFRFPTTAVIGVQGIEDYMAISQDRHPRMELRLCSASCQKKNRRRVTLITIMSDALHLDLLETKH